MFLPVGDLPNPPNFRPWATWGLIAANVGIYFLLSAPLATMPVNPEHPLLEEYLRTVLPRILPEGVRIREVLSQISAYNLFVFRHGFKPGAPQFRDLLISLFLHANFAHLFGNMLFLWIYGDNVEHRLGRGRFLLVYLATGVIATVAFSLFAGGSMVPMIGASGAISGVLGLYFLLFPRNRVKVFLFLWPIFFRIVHLPARLVIGLFIVWDNLIPVLFKLQTGVAYGAHLGGFLGGLAIAYAGEHLRSPRWRRRWPVRRGIQIGRAHV
jgi:membrane associated rhomboid family serine protease